MSDDDGITRCGAHGTVCSTPGVTARRAARADGLTVGGVVTLGTFFAVGEPWGTLNDRS